MSDDLAGVAADLRKYLARRSHQRGDDPEIVHAFDGAGPEATVLTAAHLRTAVDAIEALAIAEEALRMIANPELSFLYESREISADAIAKIAALKGGAE